MKKMRIHRLGTLSHVIIAIMATMIWGSLSAQEPNTLLTVRIIEVNTDKSSDFVDLQKEMAEARKAAGMPGRWVWQEVMGNTSTFHVVTVGENFAEFDEDSDPVLGEAGMATWISRITKTIKSREVYAVRMYSDLEIKPKEGQEANLLVLSEFKVAQGRFGDFRQWLGEKLVPALKKLGVTGRSYGRTLYGGSFNTYISAQHYETWAELDQTNMFTSLSDEEREDLWSGVEGLVVERERIILRYRADMSHDDPE
jgi:hypothetical protein